MTVAGSPRPRPLSLSAVISRPAPSIHFRIPIATLRNVSGNNFLVQRLQEKKDYTQEERNATEKEKACETVETETAVKDVSRTSRGADETGAVSNCGEETGT
ncbi:hypothetical protein NDU88_002851 [Pleurodeles waltl]|uniref:Uncharacterized protein n=1 Tax=Pleurodeles waltl TaxID=8319 RepID=A0AAV7KT98_PLEWA|nr:hypothetical protein NDU88_002851 [Pleurodeles waltl]